MKIGKCKRKNACINSMEINQIFNFPYDFGKREKETCVNSSGMNAMFHIPHNFRLSVKFSTHMISNTREKIGLALPTTSDQQLCSICPHYCTKQVLFLLTQKQKDQFSSGVTYCSFTSMKNAFSKVLQKFFLMVCATT